MVYLANIVRLLFSIYIILIFIRVLFAWLRPNMFNPIVRFVYTLTNPYLRLFAGLKFLRIGVFDLTPILAFYFLYLLQELVYRVILMGYFSLEILLSLCVLLLFRFVYFILIIFLIVLALRLIFELARIRGNNPVIAAVYSLSEPAIRPVRRMLRLNTTGGFDISLFISLICVVLLRFIILPRILKLLTMLISRSGL
ncbi:MAG: YggT family protein [Spirochaetota bacterium]